MILDLFFNGNNGSKSDFNAAFGQNGGVGENAQTGAKEEKARRKKDGDGGDAQEAARRSALVEKAVSFAATLLDRWARSNDAKFLLAINGDESAPFNKSDVRNAKKSSDWEKQDERGDWERRSAWDGRVESGGGALRRALTRLATVEAPRVDRLAETVESIDPRVLANAQVFIVSVAPLDAIENEEIGETEEIGEMGKTVVSTRGLDERWSVARRIDVSATDFDDYFEF
ncbi:MAG: hypothetical protein IIW01_11035 [Thermoguttaceae bacterium]|nr:hypothetical protein [Thermoguttaceae bacterium]